MLIAFIDSKQLHESRKVLKAVTEKRLCVNITAIKEVGDGNSLAVR